MSRSTRRNFATPFVLTIAALPACVPTSSSPPPQRTAYQAPGEAPPPTNQPPQQGQPGYVPPGQPGYVPPTTNQPPQNQPDQPGTIANPPRPATQPTQPTQPTNPTNPGQTPVVVRDQPAQPTQPGTIANPPRPAQPTTQPAQPKQPVNPGKVDPQPSKDPTPTTPTTGTATPTARHWNVRRAGTTCTAMTNNACSFPNRKPGDPIPPCNPPPPQPIACPAGLADGAALTVVQPANDPSCYIDQPAPKCAPGKTCNAPALAKTSCPR